MRKKSKINQSLPKIHSECACEYIIFSVDLEMHIIRSRTYAHEHVCMDFTNWLVYGVPAQ